MREGERERERREREAIPLAAMLDIKSVIEKAKGFLDDASCSIDRSISLAE